MFRNLAKSLLLKPTRHTKETPKTHKRSNSYIIENDTNYKNDLGGIYKYKS